MVPIRFHSLLLGLMLVLLGLPYSSASIFQEAATVASGDGRLLNRNDAVLVNQEFPTKPEAITTGSRKLKGWRMVEEADDEVMKETMKVEEGKVNAASKMSGKDGLPEKQFGSLKAAMDDKKSSNFFKAKTTLNIVATEAGNDQGKVKLSNPKPASSAYGSTRASSASKAEKNESEKLLKEALDTLNMLSMDYNHKPRRKPPINNDQPLSTVHHVFRP